MRIEIPEAGFRPTAGKPVELTGTLTEGSGRSPDREMQMLIGQGIFQRASTEEGGATEGSLTLTIVKILWS